MRKAVAAIAWLVVSSSLGAGTLFPTPLHLVRRIEDPLSGTPSTTVEEFCYGDRIVSVSTNNRVAITDFASQTLTEIDRANGTYSVTRFDDIAKARPASVQSKATVTVRIDRTIALSKDAVEAIVGAAYPNRRDAQHEQILAAAAPSKNGGVAAQSTTAAYGLPIDTTTGFEEGLTVHNVIVRFDHDLPPAQLMVIDPGATRVESRLTRMSREMQQLDKLPKQ